MGLALCSFGCASSKDEVAKQLEEIKREMTTLRASNAALKDRLDMIESTPSAAHVDGKRPGEATGDRPFLEVVHLAPLEEAEADTPVLVAPANDDEPAMDIVGDGTGVKEVEPGAKLDPKGKPHNIPVAKKRGR